MYRCALELRFDLFKGVALDEIQTIVQGFSFPLLFTYRQSCAFTLEDLLLLEPSYVDVSIEEAHLIQKKQGCKWILSYHNYKGMPKDLSELLSYMQATYADYYKIAVTVDTSLQALEMLLFMKKHKDKVIGVAMGERGQITRILSPCIGSSWTYGAVDKEEHGQLFIQTLEKTYRFSKLSTSTRVYGLIGSPVTSSISECTHNRFFQEIQEDAVYVKMDLSKEEVAEFLPLALEVFSALSVTMPLKESIDSTPCNTLVAEGGRWVSYNTDGKGALRAIEKCCRIPGSRIALLGTGGTAKAIAEEVKRRGGEVCFFSRNKEKERNLNKVQGLWQEADVLVNCTPADDPPIRGVKANCFMEVKTKELLTPFLQKGKNRIYGYILFTEQAKLQFALFGIQGDLDKLDTIVKEHIYQLAKGGIEHKIASGFPPERKPNLVPLS